MRVDGQMRKEIRDALIDAFPGWNQLVILVDERLSENLQKISSQFNDLETVAHDLITWARARGRLTELVIGAAAESDRNARLRAVADRFRFAEALGGEHERIVLEDVPFENAGEWLETMARHKRRICRFEPQPLPDKQGYATAFLVGPDVVLTNYHVVKDLGAPGAAERVVVRFDLEGRADGTPTEGRPCRLAGAWLLASSPLEDLDFALVRLAERVGDDAVPGGGTRGFLEPKDATPAPGRPLIILQHPDALPLKLSIGTVLGPDEADPRRIRYRVNTLGGSSGSPCLLSSLEVVALHHWGGIDHNRGVRLGPILARLGPAARAAMTGA